MTFPRRDPLGEEIRARERAYRAAKRAANTTPPPTAALSLAEVKELAAEFEPPQPLVRPRARGGGAS